LIYPQAVGGDIGCGMLAVATNLTAERLHDPKAAGQILAGLAKAVPSRRRNRQAVIAQPQDLDSVELSNVRLESIRRSEGTLEFATLGSGNHFLEFQSDDEDRLWLMIHSGSRALGQAIRDHHLAGTQVVDGRFRALDAESEQGAAYLHDLDWARRYAAASRQAMAAEAEKVIGDSIGAQLIWETSITTTSLLSSMVPATSGFTGKAPWRCRLVNSASCRVPWGRSASMSKAADVRKRSTPAHMALEER